MSAGGSVPRNWAGRQHGGPWQTCRPSRVGPSVPPRTLAGQGGALSIVSEGTADVAPAGRLLNDVRNALDLGISSLDGERSSALGPFRRRLDEPLRVAFAGRVKAGKSTLLN